MDWIKSKNENLICGIEFMSLILFLLFLVRLALSKKKTKDVLAKVHTAMSLATLESSVCPYGHCFLPSTERR
jgi:hypothetical protein